jgi:hypothetical protein
MGVSMVTNRQVFNKFTISLLYFVIIASYSILWLPHHVIVDIGREDAVIENMGALFFLGAALVFWWAFCRSDYRRADESRFLTDRNLAYLFLGILMFVCFGEEISWGQRLLGFETPELLMELNAQEEVTIHNLWLFHYTNPDGTTKSFWALLLNMNRLFSIFWLSFVVILPLLALKSGIIEKAAFRLRIPLAPLWIGGLFLANYLIFKPIYLVLLDSIPGNVLSTVDELKESLYAMNYFVFAGHELLRTYGDS